MHVKKCLHTFLLGGKEAQEEEGGRKSGASGTCQGIKSSERGQKKGLGSGRGGGDFSRGNSILAAEK